MQWHISPCAGEFLAAKQTNHPLDAMVASFLAIPEANLPDIFLPPDNFSGFKANLSIWMDELLEEIRKRSMDGKDLMHAARDRRAAIPPAVVQQT